MHRSLALFALFALACDPSTPSGNTSTPDPDPDTELVTSDSVPCPDAWGGEFGPLQVDSYDWQGQIVLVSQPDCCDMFVEVRDAATCDLLCAPEGGFSGTGDGNCPDFYDESEFLRTEWVRAQD